MLLALTSSPAVPRVAPFAVYIGFMLLESALRALGWSPGSDGRFAIYAVQVITVAWMLWSYREEYVEFDRLSELRVHDWAYALGAGVLVWVLWGLLDQPWARIGEGRNLAELTTASGWPIANTLMRIIGAVLVVPVMEELFWRSFLARWLVAGNFLGVQPRAIGIRALLISACVFGLEHDLVLAGIAAGVVYGALYMATSRLWVPILAHALTNALIEAESIARRIGAA